MSKRLCPCGCGSVLGSRFGYPAVVCAATWFALPQATQDMLDRAIVVDPRARRGAERIALELARTIRDQRPKPAVQGALPLEAATPAQGGKGEA